MLDGKSSCSSATTDFNLSNWCVPQSVPARWSTMAATAVVFPEPQSASPVSISPARTRASAGLVSFRSSEMSVRVESCSRALRKTKRSQAFMGARLVYSIKPTTETRRHGERQDTGIGRGRFNDDLTDRCRYSTDEAKKQRNQRWRHPDAEFDKSKSYRSLKAHGVGDPFSCILHETPCLSVSVVRFD